MLQTSAMYNKVKLAHVPECTSTDEVHCIHCEQRETADHDAIISQPHLFILTLQSYFPFGKPWCKETNQNQTFTSCGFHIFSPHSLTGAGEDHIVEVSIEGVDSLHSDLCVVDVFGDEARAVADGQHRVLQQRVVPHELQSLIGQLEGRVDVLHAVQVSDALKRITIKSND